MNGTLRDNIVMKETFDQAFYENVLNMCKLNEDLNTFPKKDMTEIGSKGINLSGGQKQRVSIARAIYSQADIFIIDDCLSALDPGVSASIFKDVIKNFLSGKTRVFVTHGMNLLIDFDRSTN